MAVQLQLRRGTTSQNNSFTGAIGELSYDTSLNQVRIHDSVTAGGKILQDTSNLVTTLTSANTDSQYASAKCLYDALSAKQPNLVSGSNIKTINNESLLGSGNITITTTTTWAAITGDITESNALMAQLNAKQNNLTAGTGISIAANGVISSTAITEVDNKSITNNSSSQIQTVGVIDQNNTSVADKLWTGTLAEYSALSSKDSNTFYHITDDETGGLSVYTKTEVDTLLVSKVNKNLDNSTVITNCLTNIPQDIKLELSSGVLTLKAGSKVYVPNGSGVFDTVTTTADITATRTSNPTGTCYGFLSQDMTKFYVVQKGKSGTSTSIHASCMYYRTDTNVVYLNNSAGYGNFSFPLCEVTYSSSSSAFTSIDQVFNGFGYIGTSLFALPGVKGLIPNGRNSDGSLNNTEFTTSSVIVSNDSWSGDKSIGLSASGISALAYTYNEKDNYVYDESSAVAQRCIVGQISYDTSTTSSQKQVFHAVDYSEADFVIAFQKPTSDNNYTWYRKYKSGWVEMGGHATPLYAGQQVTFPITMANTNYNYGVTGSRDSGLTGFIVFIVGDKTTTGMKIYGNWNNEAPSDTAWTVSGMYAQ